MKSEREEFCKRIGQEEIDRQEHMKNNLPERFAKLKNIVKEEKNDNVSNNISEVYKMAKELITLCEEKYGVNLEKMYCMSQTRIGEIYQTVSHFIWEIEDLNEEINEKEI